MRPPVTFVTNIDKFAIQTSISDVPVFLSSLLSVDWCTEQYKFAAVSLEVVLLAIVMVCRPDGGSF